jgi:uncharacterized protein YecE (DUF72 family)
VTRNFEFVLFVPNNSFDPFTGETVAARFDYDYNEKEIGEFDERVRNLAEQAEEAHVVFNNNNLDYAPRAGLRLRKALGQPVPASAETAELF